MNGDHLVIMKWMVMTPTIVLDVDVDHVQREKVHIVHAMQLLCLVGVKKIGS